VLRIAARRPAAALDPGASTGPGAGVIGQAVACPMGARSPSPLLWVDRVWLSAQDCRREGRLVCRRRLFRCSC